MRKIVLSVFSTLFLLTQVMGQGGKVSGTVTSATDKAPLAGVTVVVIGASTGATTLADGKYTINAPANAVLRFSFLGYKNQDVVVGNKSVVNVVMESSSEMIEDVVVLAYGSTQKKDLTGSVATINSETIGKQQVSNVTRALEGTVAGIQVTSSTNQPGSSSSVVIRGVGSLYATSNALVILDGTPYSGNMADINPADVESITVSKDATSNSLYGSRAANGILFVTTKKGKANAPRMSFDFRAGINSRAVPEYDMITNSGEYMEAQWNTLRNTTWRDQTVKDLGAAGLTASQNLLANFGNYNPYSFSSAYVIDPATGKLDPSAKLLYQDRLQDELFQNSPRYEGNFSVSGGNETSDYYFSLGYIKDESYIIESGYERYSMRLNLNSKIKKWAKIGASVSYARSSQQSVMESAGAANSAFLVARSWEPIYPVYARGQNGEMLYNADGTKMYDLGTGQTYGTSTRPGTMGNNIIASMKLDDREAIGNMVSARTYLDIYFLKHFTLTFNASVDSRSDQSLEARNPFIGDGAMFNGRNYTTNSFTYATTLNQLLNYKRTIDNTHNINVVLGHEYYDNTFDYRYMHKTNMFDPYNSQLNNYVNMENIDGYRNIHRIEGYFGKGEYNFKSKYYGSASVRRDGTSRFQNQPWGTFWTVGGAWRITEESFMEVTQSWLSEAKLRASYGTQGNEGISTLYPFTDTWSIVKSADGSLGTVYSSYGNPNLSWEEQKTFDVGLDLRFLDKISVTLDYFHRINDGLLFSRTLDISSGKSSIWENIGKIQNTGFELDVQMPLFVNKDWRWDVAFNATHVENKMLTLPAQYKENGMASGNQRIFEGKDIYRWYLRKFAGVNQDTGKSIWYMDEEDVDGNPTGNIVTTEDQAAATYYLLDKSGMADVTGGISTNLKWKNIDFSAITSFQIGGYGYDSSYSAFMSSNFPYNRLNDYWEAWDPANPTKHSNVPMFVSGDTGLSAASDRFLVSKTYFCIKSLTLGYSLPVSVTKKLGINNMRVYAACDNVAMFSKRKGYDPRQSMSGSSGDYYVPIRTMSIGLNINF